MFSGLIQQVGKLSAIETAAGGLRLFIRAGDWRPPLALGESMAVNGVCLTICDIRDNVFACDVLRETLDKTTLGRKRQECSLNLERALALGERLGGHLVSGHVDGTGAVVRRESVGRDILLRIACDAALIRDMALKGSVACDGVSLTITRLSDENEADDHERAGTAAFFETHLIPFTRAHSTLGDIGEGDMVNIETDMIAKYVRRFLDVRQESSLITVERLRRAGFEE